jgi:predicted TIM-barrel fold metal-dependent hydrolase
VRTISDDIVAIDTHVHLSDERSHAAKPQRANQMAQYFGRRRRVVPVDEMAEYYRSRRMLAVIMNSVDITVTGQEPVPNDHIADVVNRHPDVFLGFGVVDPALGVLAEREIRRCKELGLAGIGELNPARQHFFPNDQRFYPLWETAAELEMPVLFHGGYAAAGSGTPGGMGVKLKYANPLYLDEVAADLPNLTLICAHPSWPWESEALAVTLHKQNVFMDLSGWAPKYMSQEVRTYVNSRIQDKVLFGSDWPVIDVDRWMSEFDELGFKPQVRDKVLLDNAKRLFGLEQSSDRVQAASEASVPGTPPS